MGTIKFEIDLPEFEKELSINLIIRRDGEVLFSTSSPSMGNSSGLKDENSKSELKSIVDNGFSEHKFSEEKPKQESKPSVKKGRVIGGNMMNVDL